jgi:hypothetical protein
MSIANSPLNSSDDEDLAVGPLAETDAWGGNFKKWIEE